MPVSSCVPAVVPSVTHSWLFPVVSNPPNSIFPLKTVKSLGVMPVEAAPLMLMSSYVPFAVPLVTHRPVLPLASTPPNSTSPLKTVKPEGFDTELVELVAALRFGATV
jgi:hypothetical protein